MDIPGRDPRDMTDEETTKWMQELIDKLRKEKGSTGGACSLEALKGRVRREILNALAEKPLARDALSEKVRVTGDRLTYHLNILRSSYFLHIEGEIIDLTPAGFPC